MTAPVSPEPPGSSAAHLVEICQGLHDACLRAAHAGLKKGGPYASARHINLLLDCADATRSTRDFALRNSELTSAIADACAIICAACARTCEHAGDEALAILCRRCAVASRRELKPTQNANQPEQP